MNITVNIKPFNFELTDDEIRKLRGFSEEINGFSEEKTQDAFIDLIEENLYDMIEALVLKTLH